MSIDRLEAIFDRLGKIESGQAAHHARVEGQMERIGDKLTALDEKVKTQNGRVGRLEDAVSDLQVKAQIADSHEAEDDARQTAISARAWGFITGTGLVILGAVLGHFL